MSGLVKRRHENFVPVGCAAGEALPARRWCHLRTGCRAAPCGAPRGCPEVTPQPSRWAPGGGGGGAGGPRITLRITRPHRMCAFKSPASKTWCQRKTLKLQYSIYLSYTHPPHTHTRKKKKPETGCEAEGACIFRENTAVL